MLRPHRKRDPQRTKPIKKNKDDKFQESKQPKQIINRICNCNCNRRINFILRSSNRNFPKHLKP